MKIVVFVVTVNFLDVALQSGLMVPVAATLGAVAILWRLSLAPLPN